MQIHKTLDDYVPTSRLAEFEKWGFAITETMGGFGKKFIKVFSNNILKQEKEAVEANTLVSALVFILSKQKRNTLVYRPIDLLNKIKRVTLIEGLDIKPDTMPKSARGVTAKLETHISLLRKIGILYKHNGKNQYGAIITLKRLKKLKQQS